MSLKENIDMVKEELNSEEKFFEKAVITERFVKKYKKPLIAGVVAIAVVVAANIGYEMNKQRTLEVANETLAQLQNNGADASLQAELESLSPALHDLWLYAHSIANNDVKSLKKLKDSKDGIVSDLATYEAASRTQDAKALQEYAAKNEAIYKDLANVELAILYMNENKIDAAHEKLAMIPVDSPLSKIATSLKHYGIK